MGRLFQYNRLGNGDNAEKDNLQSNGHKRKKSEERKSICPFYSELYSEYEASNSSKSKPYLKENRWINDLSCTGIFNEHQMNQCCKHIKTRDSELLLSSVKRTKVYNCMKEFFKRRLFQHQNGLEEIDKISTKPWKMAEDVTSDYEDVDNVDSSYNADEEDENDDDISNNCDCLATPKAVFCAPTLNSKFEKIFKNKDSTLRSVISFNCWQTNSQRETGISTDTEENCEKTSNSSLKIPVPNDNISDDAGISDCCQLIVRPPRITPMSCRKAKKFKINGKKVRHYRLISTSDDDEDDCDEYSDLLKASWYQPRITTKAAYERLLKSSPGSFLVRRKARTFELCLRAETKVKHFTVIGNDNETYKLKGAKKQFSSLEALVTHHSVMAEQLPITLSLPRSEQLCTHGTYMQRCDDDFDTFESLQILGILQTLQAKNFAIS